MHPFETLFVKSSWHVGEPFVSAYSRWGARLASPSSSSSSSSPGDGNDETDAENEDGDETLAFDAGTRGQFDEPRYRYAISPEAQEDWGASQCFGKGAPPLPEWRKRSEGKGGGLDDDEEGGWRGWWRT